MHPDAITNTSSPSGCISPACGGRLSLLIDPNPIVWPSSRFGGPPALDGISPASPSTRDTPITSERRSTTVPGAISVRSSEPIGQMSRKREAAIPEPMAPASAPMTSMISITVWS